MRLIRLAALAAAAILSIGAGKPTVAPAGPHGNWLATVSISPSGGHLLGNPEAPVKVIEYISYTCPHCAHFQKESEIPMRIAYVQPGKVQVEVRHLIRDPVDMVVAMLTNCGPPNRFFANHNMFLQMQDKWIVTDAKASDGQRSRWYHGDNASRMRAIAADFGFYDMMETRGYDRTTVDRCLADTAAANRIAAQTVEGGRLGVNGTPGFMLNGVLLTGTYDWASLNNQIEARF